MCGRSLHEKAGISRGIPAPDFSKAVRLAEFFTVFADAHEIVHLLEHRIAVPLKFWDEVSIREIPVGCQEIRKEQVSVKPVKTGLDLLQNIPYHVA